MLVVIFIVFVLSSSGLVFCCFAESDLMTILDITNGYVNEEERYYDS